jgi:hypothetical protein
MVTIKVVAVPPWRGSASVGMFSSRAVKAMPRCRFEGQPGDLVHLCPGTGAGAGAGAGVGVEVAAAGCGDGVEVGGQAAGDVVGDAGVEVGGPVAAGPEGEPGGGVGAGLGGQERLVLGLVGGLGGEVVQDAGSEDPQLAGSEVAGFFDEEGFGFGEQVVAEVGRERVEGFDDHAGLGQVDGSGGERGR